MGSQRTRAPLRRLVTMLVKLSDSGAEGMRAVDLARELSVSPATIYRDLNELEAAGVELERATLEGERRIVLAAPRKVPCLGFDERTRHALSVVLRGLKELEGTFIEQVLDGLVRNGRVGGPASVRKAGPSADVVEAFARGLEKRQRVRFQYRGDRYEAPCERVVEPLELRVERGQLYLLAWDLEKDDVRTFKPARASRAFVLPERAKKRDIDLTARMAHSVRIWDGDLTEVAIRVSAEKARYLNEWPLHRAQALSSEPDGSVVVRAKVNGLQEALRWTLSWGADAEALEPGALREMVRRELEGAAARYGGTRGSASGVSRGS